MEEECDFDRLLEELIRKYKLHQHEKDFSFKKHPFYKLGTTIYRHQIRKILNEEIRNTNRMEG